MHLNQAAAFARGGNYDDALRSAETAQILTAAPSHAAQVQRFVSGWSQFCELFFCASAVGPCSFTSGFLTLCLLVSQAPLLIATSMYPAHVPALSLLTLLASGMSAWPLLCRWYVAVCCCFRRRAPQGLQCRVVRVLRLAGPALLQKHCPKHVHLRMRSWARWRRCAASLSVRWRTSSRCAGQVLRSDGHVRGSLLCCPIRGVEAEKDLQMSLPGCSCMVS